MGAGLDRREAIDEIKADFIRRLEKYREDDNSIVLFYESDAVATLDDSPGAVWKFSTLQIKAEADGTTTQNAFLDQPLRAPHYSQLAQADNIIPEAFDDLPAGSIVRATR